MQLVNLLWRSWHSCPLRAQAEKVVYYVPNNTNPPRFSSYSPKWLILLCSTCRQVFVERVSLCSCNELTAVRMCIHNSSLQDLETQVRILPFFLFVTVRCGQTCRLWVNLKHTTMRSAMTTAFKAKVIKLFKGFDGRAR